MKLILQALKSKTVLIAIAQAVVGIAVLVLTEANLAGEALLLKSVLDVIIRSKTTVPLSEK